MLPRLLLPLIALIATGSLAGAAGDPSPLRAASTDRAVGILETVAELDGPAVTGIAVSRAGRVFVSFPHWADPLEYSMAEIRNGKPVPFPSQASFDETKPASDRLICVQSVIIDSRDRLWALDAGSVRQGPVIDGGPKLVGYDLATGKIVQRIVFPREALKPNSYLNDVRIDLRRGGGWAFITDCKDRCALIVADLTTGACFRRLEGDPSVMPRKDFLPVIEGRPTMIRSAGGQTEHLQTGCDGIALSPDGQILYYCPLSSRNLYSIRVDALLDRGKVDLSRDVTDYGDKGTAADGLEMDNRNRLYITSLEHNAVLRRDPQGNLETLVHDPRLLWTDTLAISPDGYLYLTVNQLNRQPRFHAGKDLRTRPWLVFRLKLDAGPAWQAVPKQ